MSVSLAEMVGHDRNTAQSSASSKKRKHTDDERAERKKKKKQKQIEVEDSTEVFAAPEAAETSKKKNKEKKRKRAPIDEVQEHAPGQLELQADIELPDVDMEDAEAPATDETSTIPKKDKKQKVSAEDKASSSATPAATEREEIELPDADDEILLTPLPIAVSTSSIAQPKPPSHSTENTPFHKTRASLYVPCPAISLSSALPSLISTHLTPLLLTYYAPLNGIILSFSNVSLSSTAASEPGKPLVLPDSPTNSQSQLALCADTDGVSFTWLSFTATTFRPTPTSTLTGYINVASEGFIGLVLYNYFQIGIARNRIPRDWKWTAPGRPKSSKKQPKKGRIRDPDSEESSQLEPVIQDSQTSGTQQGSATLQLQNTGYWTKTDGSILKDSDAVSFRVVDCDIVPSTARNSEKMALQIEGTLLDEEKEKRILAEERANFERAQNKAHGRTNSPGSKDQANVMSGGLVVPGRAGSAATPVQRHRVAY